MRTRLLDRASGERGAVLVVVSLAMVVMIGATALAVDVGRVTTNNRELQAVADVIALDAVRVLGQGIAEVQAAAAASAVRNDFPAGQLTVEIGTKNGTSAFVPTVASPNAVRITSHGSVDFAFAPGGGSSNRSAVAIQTNTAGFSVGSYVAAIPPGGNTVLSALFGDAFGLSLVGYDGLANASVTLEAIGLNMPVAMTPNQLLATSVNMRDFFIASAAAVNPSNTAAVNILNTLKNNVPAGQTIDLGRSLAIETGGEAAAASAELNLLQILTANALAADGVHTINIPKTALALPGIGDVEVALTVTNPAKTVFGPIGTSAGTGQVSLTVNPKIQITTGSGTVDICKLGLVQGLLQSLFGLSVLQALNCALGIIGVNRIVSLDLTAAVPITVAVAGAQATLTDVDCGTPKRLELTPALQPASLTGSANVQLAGSLLGQPLGSVAQVTGSLNTQVSGGSPPAAWYDETEFGQAQSVGTQSLGLGDGHPMTFGSVTVLNTNVAGPLNTVTGSLGSVLNGALETVGTGVIEPLNALLGLNLFGADLTPLSVACGGVRLVE